MGLEPLDNQTRGMNWKIFEKTICGTIPKGDYKKASF
jgi:hypothetical protein